MPSPILSWCSQPSRHYCPTKDSTPVASRHQRHQRRRHPQSICRHRFLRHQRLRRLHVSHRRQRFLQVYRHRQKRQQLRLHGKLRWPNPNPAV